MSTSCSGGPKEGTCGTNGGTSGTNGTRATFLLSSFSVRSRSDPSDRRAPIAVLVSLLVAATATVPELRAVLLGRVTAGVVDPQLQL